MTATNILDDGLSSVYTFYDPDVRGVVLQHLQHHVADQTSRTARYALGVSRPLIKESPKMAYKINLRPLEALRQGQWSALE